MLGVSANIRLSKRRRRRPGSIERDPAGDREQCEAEQPERCRGSSKVHDGLQLGPVGPPGCCRETSDEHAHCGPRRTRIRWRGQELSLTLTEFWLIESMARHPGHVKTYENMMQITRQSYVERNTINGYIRRIRNKFKEIDPSFKNIQTVFGVGYKWSSSS